MNVRDDIYTDVRITGSITEEIIALHLKGYFGKVNP